MLYLCSVLHIYYTTIVMIEIENLSFGYHRLNPVLESINLSIKSGIYVLMGENGIGKTTLLHLMSSLCFPSSGYCFVNNMNTAHRSPEFLKDVFFLPEELRTPTESILDFASRHAKFYPFFDRDNLMDNLKEMGVDGNAKISELSFGQKKKALISYSLSLKTPILLLDEPTNGLDIFSKQKLQKLLAQNMREDQTLIISTHSVNDFKNLFEALIFLIDKETVISDYIDSISSKFLFVNCKYLPSESLYYEQNIDGYSAILHNHNNLENTIDPEFFYRGLLKCFEMRKLLIG